jgi:cytochrome c oxidase subunit 4
MKAAKRPNYLLVFALLGVFTFIEVLASYIQQPALKVPTLIVLSQIKVILVLLYFMHLRFDSRIYTYLFVGGVIATIPLFLVMVFVMPKIS